MFSSIKSELHKPISPDDMGRRIAGSDDIELAELCENQSCFESLSKTINPLTTWIANFGLIVSSVFQDSHVYDDKTYPR